MISMAHNPQFLYTLFITDVNAARTLPAASYGFNAAPGTLVIWLWAFATSDGRRSNGRIGHFLLDILHNASIHVTGPGTSGIMPADICRPRAPTGDRTGLSDPANQVKMILTRQTIEQAPAVRKAKLTKSVKRTGGKDNEGNGKGSRSENRGQALGTRKAQLVALLSRKVAATDTRSSRCTGSLPKPCACFDRTLSFPSHAQ